jgi:DNA-binding winged helix-turn-helix (wHTH) protein
MVYQFNQFTLDTDQYQLSLSDKPISIEPLTFDLLVYLIEHRDRVVTREELFENLWQGKVVTDAALGARLKDTRKAIQDSAQTAPHRVYNCALVFSDLIEIGPK